MASPPPLLHAPTTTTSSEPEIIADCGTEAAPTTAAAAYEAEHVHAVYEQIASHFSATRYKAWPIVSRFLADQPPGSIGLDVGCGNGKYLSANPRIFIIGSDRSPALASIAHKSHPRAGVLVSDILSLPHARGRADFALAIAVVHHLASSARRVAALRALFETVKARGRVLVYVWALEQEESRRGWREGGEQDVLVPWVMARGRGSAETPDGNSQIGQKTFQRFYHLYTAGELERDISAAGGTVEQSGYERDNWWAIATPA
ncbi:MAG: tRNA methyltransferase, has a role in tRNA modification [Trizodia sp. TS-e1964]|nr:MAG: tRNA methyltransferase, has a role in tRNA modification [Trizodia sp. TS-e1964]